MNLDVRRQVTRRVWMSADVSLDECRKMAPFSCCCNLATVGHIGMQIFNFIVPSVIIAHHSVLSPRISKTHLPISSLNVGELKLN